MRIIIYVNETFEEECALYNLDTNELLLKGDYYHDKINEKIEGFLQGLDYCGYEYEIQTTEYITPDMDIFNKFEFYNDSCDGEDEEIEEDIQGEIDEESSLCDTYTDINELCPTKDNKTVYNFKISHYDYDSPQPLYTQNIFEALNEVRKCEGDLYDGDRLVYSCLGFTFEENLEKLEKYNVVYDDAKKGFISKFIVRYDFRK